MADIKISELGEATLPLDGTEDMVIVQDGVTKRCATQDAADIAKGCKKWEAIVTLTSGPTFTIDERINDFGATTFTLTNPSNSNITVTASTAVFTNNKSVAPGSSINDAGTPYFLCGAAVSTTVFNFKIIKYDGSATGTPFFTRILFEIRVYN